MSGPDAAAIVPAGGAATRLGGVDKASVVVDGRMLVDHVYRALSFCRPIVAVGPPSLQRPGVTVAREDPPGGGPVAAIAAGLKAVDQGTADTQAAGALPAGTLPAGALPAELWLFACDLPRAGEIAALLRSVPLEGADAVVPVDAAGRRQWLAARYRAAALRDAVDRLAATASAQAALAGASMRALTVGLRLRTVDDLDGATTDLDTWAAIDQYREDKEEHHGRQS